MKIFRGFLALAATAAAFTMSSCMDNSIPSVSLTSNLVKDETATVKLGTITQSDNYTFTIKASTKVNLYVDGARVAVANSYKGEKKKNSEITIKADAVSEEYSNVEVTKKVKMDANGKVIYIDIPKIAKGTKTIIASEAKAKAEANGSVAIDNSTTNQKLSYSAATKANIVLSKSAVSNIADDKTLSIDVENASTANIEQVLSTEGVEEDFDVMVIKSATKKVSLGESAKVTVNNSNFEKGMIFKCSNKNEEMVVKEDAKISFDVNELNDYTISCHAIVMLDSISDAVPLEGRFTVPATKPDVTYNTRSGYTCEYNSNEFITKYLNAKFGAYTENGTQTVKIVTDQKVSVPYKITQKLYHYTVKFGEISIKVKVYGEDELEIITDKAEKYNIPTAI